MKTFHVDEPREIGKQKVRLSKKELMVVKDNLTERIVREKIREIIKQINVHEQQINEIYPFIITAIMGTYTKNKPKDINIVRQLKTKYKGWKKDLQLKKIANKLKDDKVVLAMLQSPSKEGKAWKSVIKSRLSNLELKYLNMITKRFLKSYI